MVSLTISGWIKNVLKEAGIDTKIFKGHSTPSASILKGGLAGLSVNDILEVLGLILQPGNGFTKDSIRSYGDFMK